jgi:hypothetical protein
MLDALLVTGRLAGPLRLLPGGVALRLRAVRRARGLVDLLGARLVGRLLFAAWRALDPLRRPGGLDACPTESTAGCGCSSTSSSSPFSAPPWRTGSFSRAARGRAGDSSVTGRRAILISARDSNSELAGASHFCRGSRSSLPACTRRPDRVAFTASMSVMAAFATSCWTATSRSSSAWLVA